MGTFPPSKTGREERILISGGWGYGNLGDNAILDATLDLVRDAFASDNVTVLSHEPDETREAVPLGKARVDRMGQDLTDP